MPIVNPSPPKAASAGKRLAFCQDQLDILNDLCLTLNRSILANSDSYYHSDVRVIDFMREILSIVSKEISSVKKEAVI
jgi:hypothetical protein